MNSVEYRRDRELAFWREAPNFRPQDDSLENIFNGMANARIFVGLLQRYADFIPARGRIIELGAGQGSASCLVKRLFPLAHVTATDISEDALASLHRWARIWNVAPDRHYACLASETHEEDGSVDLAFCFASAHHFIEHEKVLQELARILRPGGHALFLYEPTAPEYLYRLAKWRVNRIRPEVPEDLLVPSAFQACAEKASLHARFDFDVSSEHRLPAAALYYGVLKRMPHFVRRLVPCAANVVISRKTHQ